MFGFGIEILSPNPTLCLRLHTRNRETETRRTYLNILIKGSNFARDSASLRRFEVHNLYRSIIHKG